MLKIQLEELEMLVAVVNFGNFSKAAEEINVTASVVSRTIKKLEDKLNTTLFNRTTRKIHLTQEGEWLFREAGSLVAHALKIESHLGDRSKEQEGTVVVDAATPFSLHAIGPLIAGFSQCYPNVVVTLQSSESNIDLIERKVDIAIRIGQLEDSNLKARKLGESVRQLYASPPYVKSQGDPKTAAELKKHACLGFVKPSKLNIWPIKDRSGHKLQVKPRTFADNGETLRQLAVQGCGIACLSSFTVREDVLSGKLVPILKDKVIQESIPLYAVFYSENEVDPRIRCFLDYISEHIDLH